MLTDGALPLIRYAFVVNEAKIKQSLLLSDSLTILKTLTLHIFDNQNDGLPINVYFCTYYSVFYSIFMIHLSCILQNMHVSVRSHAGSGFPCLTSWSLYCKSGFLSTTPTNIGDHSVAYFLPSCKIISGQDGEFKIKQDEDTLDVDGASTCKGGVSGR